MIGATSSEGAYEIGAVRGAYSVCKSERVMHNTVEDTPLLHTELPDDYLYISFGDVVWFGADRTDMTKFLKKHLDILERPGVYHITILEHELPRLRFGFLEDDEWEAQKATFVNDVGYRAVDITDGPRRFAIKDKGVVKTFEVHYTVFHRDLPGGMPGLIGSNLLPLLLTNTYLSAGVFTYAHVTALKRD